MVRILMVFAAVAALGARNAEAGSELQFDLNSITTTITDNTNGGVFDTSFTGSLRLGHDDNSVLSRIIIDGASVGFDNDLSDGDGWALSHLSAKINIVNGDVVGGFVYIEAERYAGGVATADTDTYTADIAAGIGGVRAQAGQGYTIDGLTIQGMFSDHTFAGVDVTPWFNAQPLAGSFLNFSFDPGENPFGSDENSHLDVFVVVPLPLPGLIGLAGGGFLTIIRRRRLDV